MFENQETGKKDDNGRMICCGDRVEYYQWKQGHTDRSTQDGWGRDVPLCKHDQVEVPAKEKITQGRVVYSMSCTGFIVIFDDYLINSGNKEASLYVMGKSINHDKDRLVVI